MRAFISKRPWVIILVVQVLFCTWWIAFVCYASQVTPEDAPATVVKPESHARD